MTCKQILIAQLSGLEGFRFLHGQTSLKGHEVLCVCHFPKYLARFVFSCGIINHHKLSDFKQHKLTISNLSWNMNQLGPLLRLKSRTWARALVSSEAQGPLPTSKLADGWQNSVLCACRAEALASKSCLPLLCPQQGCLLLQGQQESDSTASRLSKTHLIRSGPHRINSLFIKLKSTDKGH